MTLTQSLVKLIGTAALLVACAKATPSPEPAIADHSFTTAQPCAAPCWYGLVLNRATAHDVLAKLNELPFVDHGAVRTSIAQILSYQNATEIDFGCAEPKGELCGFLVLSDDKLKEISLVLQFRLTLQSVVEQLGKPAYFEYHAATPHGQGCFVDLKWPDKNIIVRSIDYDSDRLCQALSAGKPIDSVTLATELDYSVDSEFLARPNQCGTCGDWPGFQNQ